MKTFQRTSNPVDAHRDECRHGPRKFFQHRGRGHEPRRLRDSDQHLWGSAGGEYELRFGGDVHAASSPGPGQRRSALRMMPRGSPQVVTLQGNGVVGAALSFSPGSSVVRKRKHSKDE